MKITEFEIHGTIDTRTDENGLNDYTVDEITDLFLEFIESKGWSFGGSIRKLTEQDLKEAEVFINKVKDK